MTLFIFLIAKILVLEHFVSVVNALIATAQLSSSLEIVTQASFASNDLNGSNVVFKQMFSSWDEFFNKLS